MFNGYIYTLNEESGDHLNSQPASWGYNNREAMKRSFKQWGYGIVEDNESELVFSKPMTYPEIRMVVVNDFGIAK